MPAVKNKVRITIILLAVVVLLVFLSLHEYESRKNLVFADSLQEVAVTVDGTALTMQDMAIYIAYKENEIEEQARVYELENTDAYWNLYTRHAFLREEAKQATMDMAIHDEIFYRLAETEGIELTAEEEEHLANDQYDFWSDLEEEQRERLGVEEEQLAKSMRKIALAEKYQALLAAIEQKKFEDYSINGKEYEEMLTEHTYAVEESVWNRLRFGGITVDH